jgi:hypothetical protein
MSPTDFFSQEEYKPWTLAQIYADMAARGDLAVALNVLPRRVAGWIANREKNGCPLPIRTFGPTDVYSIQEWREWYAAFLEKNQWLDGFCAEHPGVDDQVRRFFGD